MEPVIEIYIKGTSCRDGDAITKKIKEGASFNDLLIPDQTITGESYKTKAMPILTLNSSLGENWKTTQVRNNTFNYLKGTQ